MESKILEYINNSNSILLLTHENPDGDAVGSVLGFYNFLKSINKSVDMVIQKIPKTFDFLPNINKVVDLVSANYDLGIVFDCATKERIGQNNDVFSKCNHTVCIDHHISNTKYCEINLVQGTISSCSQIVYYLLKEWNVSLSKEICEPLMCGLLTDTNGFSNNNVDDMSFNMAASIYNIGVDIHSIYNRVLTNKTMSQYNLTKTAMDRLEFYADGKVAFTYILEDDFTKYNASLGEHEGIVDIGRSIEGVEVSLFIRENDGWSFSLRSTGKVDVSSIAAILGGGGHKMAAGGKLTGSFDETKGILIDTVLKVL